MQNFTFAKFYENNTLAKIPQFSWAAVWSKAVVLLLLLSVPPIVGFCICYMFCCAYFAFILVLQLCRDSWLLCFFSLPGVSWLLCGSSLQCHGFICSLWFRYFQIIRTYSFYSTWYSRSRKPCKHSSGYTWVIRSDTITAVLIEHTYKVSICVTSLLRLSLLWVRVLTAIQSVCK